MEMQNYLAFLILKCAVTLPALETGNVLELAKQETTVFLVLRSVFIKLKVTHFTESETFLSVY